MLVVAYCASGMPPDAAYGDDGQAWCLLASTAHDAEPVVIGGPWSLLQVVLQSQRALHSFAACSAMPAQLALLVACQACCWGHCGDGLVCRQVV